MLIDLHALFTKTDLSTVIRVAKQKLALSTCRQYDNIYKYHVQMTSRYVAVCFSEHSMTFLVL